MMPSILVLPTTTEGNTAKISSPAKPAKCATAALEDDRGHRPRCRASGSDDISRKHSAESITSRTAQHHCPSGSTSLDAEHLGPDDNVKEHSARKTQQNHTAGIDDERTMSAVLLVHTDHGTPEGVRGCQAPHPANASLRRQRRKSVTTGTGESVPVPNITLLVPLANSDNLDARRCLPDSRLGATVPEVGPALTSLSSIHSMESGMGETWCFSFFSSWTGSSSELTTP